MPKALIEVDPDVKVAVAKISKKSGKSQKAIATAAMNFVLPQIISGKLKVENSSPKLTKK